MKEEEIRPKELVEKQKEFFEEDLNGLLERKKEFIFVNCPACGSDKYEKNLEKNGIEYVECENCKTTFTNPRPTPEILSKFYENSKNYKFWNEVMFPASEETRREKIFKPRVEKIIEICKKNKTPKGIIIDVGAGFGTFCEEMKKTNFFERVIAVEPTPYLSETCKKKGIETINKRIEEVDQKADVITSFEVIEHLFNPKEFLSNCSSSLSKEGILIITCPNIKGFDVNLLKEKSSTIDHEHLNYFNPNSIKNLFESSGFEVIEVSTPGKLDAELVRNEILNENFDVSNMPFLKYILIDEWNEIGKNFQKFLASNRLSSHMWVIAKKQQ